MLEQKRQYNLIYNIVKVLTSILKIVLSFSFLETINIRSINYVSCRRLILEEYLKRDRYNNWVRLTLNLIY